jgi:hypothetical protein
MTGVRRLDTGIEKSAALLPGLPRFWSFSALREAGACPRRYALSRARYPDLWDGHGYPRLPSLPAVFGDVVHGALDTIMKALVAAGCESVQSAEATQVLRTLGGYTAVIEASAEARLSGLAGNPRLRGDLQQRLQRDLSRRIADARAQVQAHVSRSDLAPAAAAPGAAAAFAATPRSPEGGKRAPLAAGTYAEVALASQHLRLAGRVDLLRVSGTGAGITDYKTGAESPVHVEQLELYALLWDLDHDANPGRLPVTSLTAAYPGRDVTVPVPDEQGMREIEKRTAAAIADAETEVSADVPRAKPSPENCANCDVRHLCDAYWPAVAPDPSALDDGSRLDCQGLVGTRQGPRSWWLHPDGQGRSRLLVQASPSGPELHPGRHVRILGLRIDADPDTGVTVASAGVATEVFTMTASSPTG